MKNLFWCILLIASLAACASPAPGPAGGSTDATAAFMPSVNNYLVKNLGLTAFGGQVFCAYDVLGTAVPSRKTDVYIWALCAEYFLHDKTLTMGTASSLPVALHLQESGGVYQVTGMEVPLDGMGYGASLVRIFPAEAIQKMCREDADCYNERAKRLEDATREQAAEFYKVE